MENVELFIIVKKIKDRFTKNIDLNKNSYFSILGLFKKI